MSQQEQIFKHYRIGQLTRLISLYEELISFEIRKELVEEYEANKSQLEAELVELLAS